MRKKLDPRIEKAQNIALDMLDYIYETYATPDYVQVVGNMCGDAITLRVYNDGKVYEK